jgi:uncharacterized iron-regulated membrane protein
MFLVRSSGADGGVKCDVGGAVLRRPRGNVSAALPIRPRERSAAALLAGHAVYGILQPPGDKRGTDLHIVTALPPAGAEGVDDGLFSGTGLAELFALLLGFLGYAPALTFFRSGS